MSEGPLDAVLLALDLFRDAILAGVLAGGVLGWIGLFVVMRRMVFVTAALSQAAALGVTLAFFAQIHLAIALPPVAGAILLSVAATLLFAIHAERWHLSRESVLGLAYAGAGALAVLFGDRITQEAHEIGAVLFGTAVLVRREDLVLLIAASAVVVAGHLWWRRGFLFASFDPDGARVNGLPVRALDATLWLLLALQVAVATRALGALPVFAFTVLPGLAALMVCRDLRTAFPLAALLGALSGGLGYLLAFLFDTPVGATQSALAGAFVLAAVPMKAWRG